MLNKSSYLIVILSCIVLGGFLYGKLDIHAGIFNDQAFRATHIKGDVFPKVLIDAIGEEYPLMAPPQRIVSATLATDEILSELVSVERISGVTYLVDNASMSSIPRWYPKQIQRVQGEAEEILSLEPDLVFVAAYTRAETVRLLLNANIPVVRLSLYDSFKDIEDNITLIGQITGQEEKAAMMIKARQQQAQAVIQKVQGLNKPRVLYYSLDGYTVGIHTKINEMIEIAGGYNVMSETDIQGTQKIGEELALSLEPEIILISGGFAGSPPPSQILATREAWQSTPAVMNEQVFDIQGTWLLSVSQYSWDGIEAMAKLIHPEVFK